MAKSQIKVILCTDSCISYYAQGGLPANFDIQEDIIIVKPNAYITFAGSNSIKIG